MAAWSTVLLLIAVAVQPSRAQQPSSPAGPVDRSRIIDPPSAQSLATAPFRPVPKTGNLPGALRQQADHRFLARRGLGLESRTGAAPTAALADRLSAARAIQARARQHSLQRPSPDAVTPGTWHSLGPAQVATAAYGLVTGRITSLAADPNDSTGNTLYVGATGGGVWKSTNAAGSSSNATFAPLTDDLPAYSNTLGSLSIGAITVQPTSSSVILAGTGDPNNALDSYYGVGILRSTDGGLTWTLIQNSKDAQVGGLKNYSFAGNGFSGFAWSSTTPSLVVAAVAQSIEGELVNAGTAQDMEAGLYYSTDAGQTWYLAVIEDSPTAIVQSPRKADSPPGNSATSVIWNPVRQRFYAAVRFHGYYESLDGITWTRLANQPGSSLSSTACPTNATFTGQTSCPIFRGALAVQPLTGDLFALTTDLNDLDQGLFEDVCSTSGLAVSACASNTVAFGTQLPSGALENGSADPTLPPTTIPLAEYDLTLAAVASQQDTVLFAGTEDIYRCSLANSCAWRNTTNIQTCAAAQVAPSQHATESTFGSNGLLYFANDGGLWRSTDTVAQTGSVCATSDASHYQNLNSGIGSLAEVTHFSVSPGGSTTLLAGIGGFGTVSTFTGQGAWQQLLTGEGSYSAIDPANIENWYTEAGSGVDIFRCTAGAGCNASGFGTTPVIGSTQDADDADYFAEPAPWILDPLNTANLLLGTCRVWRGPATGGSGWSASNLLSPMLDGNQQSFCDGNAELRSIAAGLDANGAAGTEKMYAGMAGPYDGGGTIPGHVFASTVPASGGTTTWTDLYNSPVTNSMSPQFNSGGFSISSIAVDPHDPTGQTVYVTIQGFSGNGISDGEVYGSTDAGAHWLNLTNSLPLSPANSIVVDPNVPSFLYVALDTGVYYTQNVSACSDPSQTCWAVYGAGLPNAPVTSLEVYSAGASSILEASTYGRGIWALALLTAPAQGTLSPASYTFASRQVATTSAAATFTVTNTGTTSMTLTDIEVAGDYAQTHTCGATLAASASCTIQVTFTPTVAGDRPGTLTIYANVSGGALTSTLDGTGLAPGMLTATPASLSFPATVEGASSPVQTVSIENTGGIAVQLQTLTASTDYQLSANTCNGVALAPAATCSVGITFTPSALGDRPGHLSIPSNLPASPTLVPLDGTGVTPPALTLSPTSLTFPNTAEGAISAAQSITLTSSGGATVQLQSPTVAGDYQITSNTCGATLAPGANCVLQIEFAPAATGSRPGLLTQPANVSGGQITAALNGTGVTPPALTITPASLTFPSTTQGTTSAAQSLRLTSTGGVSVQLQAPAVTGDYAISLNNCPGSLAPGASCSLQITFTPTTTGDRPGLLTVPDSTASGQVTVPLDGTGVSPPELTLLPPTLTFGATAVGTTSAALSLNVTNLGGTIAQLLAPTTTGDFAVSTNGCGSTLAPGASCTVQVTFSPTVVGTSNGVLTLGGTNLAAASPSVRPAFGRAVAAGAAPASTAGQVTAALTGTGVSPPVVTLVPVSQDFGSIVQGAASAPYSFTATNTGTIPAVLQAPSTQGDYQVSSTTCGTTLAAGNSCAIVVIFHPAGLGDRPGALVLSGSMSGGHVNATLDGVGLAPGVLTLSPGSLAFGGQLLNTTSTPPKTVTVANTGGATLTLPPATVTGDYAMVNGCGTTLAGGAHCTIQITFTPTAAGDRPGQLQQSDGIAGDAPQVVTLDGTGQRAGSVAITPASQVFGSVAVGASSSPASLTVTNSGDITVHLQTATVTGDYSVSSSCGSTLAGGASCNLQVIFTPTATGSRTGTLTLPSDAANSPATASLSGTGVAPASVSLSPGTFTFGSTVVGATSASQTFTATNGGGVTAQLGAAAASSDYVIESKTCTGTLAAAASCTLQVAFAPAAPGDRPGTLTLPGQFSSSPATATLDGMAIAAGALTLSPTSLSYGSLVTGTTSPAQSVTVTDTGGVNVTLGSSAVTGAYSLQPGGSCHANLVLAPAPAAGDSCTLLVVFSPSSAGDNPGLLAVAGNIAGGQVTATLDGTGVLPGALNLSPPLLSFGPLVLGVVSQPQTLTLKNTGGAYLDLQAPAISAEYQVASNTCGGVLQAGSQCTLGITFTPTALGDQPGLITLSASGGAIQAQSTLDGSGVAAARLVLSPTSLAFGSVQRGKVSAQQGATLSNTGGVPAQLALPVLTGDYAIASNSCGASLAPAASCVLEITFDPSTIGLRPGVLSVATADSTSSATVSLSGTGTPPPVLVLTPTTLVFPATSQGATTAAENITVANIGSTPVTLQPFTITGDFAISADTCSGTVLNPTYSCTLSITFTPTAGGVRTGLLTVSDTTETHVATLTGTGLSAATDTLSTTSLTFGPQVFGTVSPGQSVTMTNSGGSTLGSIATAITGPFIAANNCGTILGGGLTCSIAVSFAPTGAGVESGQLTITDALRSQVVSLGGQGVLPPQAVATPTSLDFGGFAVAATSPAQLVTMTNNGKTPLTSFTAMTATASYAVASNSCGDTIAAGASCTLGITFTPQQPGNAVDQLTLSSPSLNGPLTVALSGSGEDFQLSVTGSASDLVTNGQTATYHVMVTPVGVSAGSLTITCAGVPANATCTMNPASLSVSGGATGSITVTVATGQTTIATRRPPGLPGHTLLAPAAAAFAFLLPCLLLPGRARRTFLAVLVAAALVILPTACGVHASGGSSATTGSAPVGTTPPGKYAVTVTANFPGAQRSVNLILTIE